MLVGSHSLQHGFRRQGLLSCTAYTPLQMCGKHLPKILNKVSEGKFHVVWIDTPDTKTLSAIAPAFWSACESVLKRGCVAHIPILFTVNHKDEFARQVAGDIASRFSLFGSVLHHCGMGVLRGMMPCPKVSRCYSSFELTDIPCSCESGHPKVNVADISSLDHYNAATGFSESVACMLCHNQVAGLLADPAHEGSGTNFLSKPLTTAKLRSPGVATLPCCPKGSPCVPDSNRAGLPSCSHLATDSKASVKSASQVLADALSTDNGDPVSAYPTDAKERERDNRNKLKAAGVDTKAFVNKQKKYIEPHYDDCGDDVSSIMNFYRSSPSSTRCPSDASDSDDDVGSWASDSESLLSEDPQTDSLASFLLRHPDENSSDVRSFDTVHELLEVLNVSEKGIDICELCGGEGRATKLAVRRHLSGGRNFDLVTGFNLNSRADQAAAANYIGKHNVLVVVMAPTCGPFGPMSHLSKATNPKAWEQALVDALPHGEFCGKKPFTN